MRRWTVGLLIVLLSCVPIILHRESGPHLLQDTDTAYLITKIRERSAPLSWFVGDWPLENHFYRPVSTLAFEADNALYGDRSAGYGFTNALLCALCVLLLFWFIRELTDTPATATAGALLFSLWQWNGAGWLGTATAYASWAALGLMLLPGRRVLPAVLCFLGLWFLSGEIGGLRNLEYKVLDWLPGRTASVMTVFCLVALASYCRYERLSARRDPPADPVPLDPPATKGTQQVAQASGQWPWAVVALMATGLALGSYEQAVMVPGALLGTAIFLRLQRFRVRWLWHVGFWATLVGYLVLRGSLLGWESSGYQEQQFRAGTMGTMFSIFEYVFPAFAHVYSFAKVLDSGILLFLTIQPYQVLLTLASNIGVVTVGLANWKLAVLGWGLSILAFLPMAWLNPSDFHHYHYWPMAMRALFLVAIASALGRWLVTAASRPAIQAPPRSDPAPGSLPRR
jgi:hypothetical protein